MKKLSSSFRLERGSSLSNRLERSNSSLLASESISPRITTYEKLSQSSRFADETPRISHHKRESKSGWSYLSKVLSSFRKTEGQADNVVKQMKSTVEEKKKKKKKRSSWLPDPQQRWPVQGW